MNLFLSRLTGRLYSTDKMESQMIAMEERIARYRRIEQSPEMKEYLELKKVVESKEFQQKKFNWIHTKFKSTSAYETISRYKKLLHDKELQLYLELENSERLKDYLEFRQGPNYVRLQSKKEVRNSLELKQWAEFEKSKDFKAYIRYRNSKTPERFKQLVAEVSTPEYKEQYSFWSNSNRWKTTDEYQQEARYKQLAAMEDIRYFFREDRKQIETMESWDTTFQDEFEWFRMAESAWKPGFAYDNPKLKTNHSFANEQQANNGGKNVGTMDNKLCLFTKQEKVTAPAWDTKKGFINKDFDYTSDIIQTADAFRQKEGIFMVKLRVEGDIHHAVWLGSGKRLPMLSLFHYNGKHITIGNYKERGGFDGTVIRGISAKKYYIYSLRWNEREMIWYVNNVEVYRTSYNMPKEPLYFAISSFIDEQQKAQEGTLNVAWVRALKIAK